MCFFFAGNQKTDKIPLWIQFWKEADKFVRHLSRKVAETNFGVLRSYFQLCPLPRFTIRSNWKSWRIHLGVFLFVFQLYFVQQLVNFNFGLVEFSTVRLSSSARRARFWKGSRKRYFLSKIIFLSLFCGMFNFVVFWIVFQAWFCQNGE